MHIVIFSEKKIFNIFVSIFQNLLSRPFFLCRAFFFSLLKVTMYSRLRIIYLFLAFFFRYTVPRGLCISSQIDVVPQGNPWLNHGRTLGNWVADHITVFCFVFGIDVSTTEGTFIFQVFLLFL